MSHRSPEPALLLTKEYLDQQKQQQPVIESSISSFSPKQKLLLNSTQTTTTQNTCLDPNPRSAPFYKKQNRPFCGLGSRFPLKFKFKLKKKSFTPSMAGQANLAAPVPFARSVRTKKSDGQHKKEELESEVTMLLKMLDNEEKVNKILEHTISRPDGSAIHIPSFLPPKVKELLAELAMVEDEISRLEAEIIHLQKDLNQEQQISKESKIKLWKQNNMSKLHDQLSLPSYPKPILQEAKERTPFESKALYFISKAIKGDYTASPLSNNEKKVDSGEISDDNEKLGYDEIKVPDKITRTNGTLKPSFPKLPPRNSTSKLMDPEKNLSIDPPSKSMSTVSKVEEKGHKVQPNKLSESIMKCLIFIFVRLMRTSRAIELEKSGTISRSSHASVSSRSFRVETSGNPMMNLVLQKDSKQQDPYDIFDNDDSIPRDIGPYKNLVRFTSSSLDSKSISISNSSPLLQKLRVLLNNLQNVDLRFFTQSQKLAFWINIYNACIMHGFIQYGVPPNQESLLALMKRATLNVGGYKLNAVEIENFILRQPSSSNLKDVYWNSGEYAKESVIRNYFGLDSLEPNITFALCCGTRSSPAVRIYTANSVSVELEKSKLDYLQAAIIVTKTKRLILPELLIQNMFDFSSDIDSLVEWVCQQLPTSWSLRKSMVECFRAHNSRKISTIVDKMPYEFDFQYLLFV